MSREDEKGRRSPKEEGLQRPSKKVQVQQLGTQTAQNTAGSRTESQDEDRAEQKYACAQGTH